MIGEGRKWPQLRAYPWSSLPYYLVSRRKRPEWLHAGEVLGRLQWKDTPKGRRAYADYLEARAMEEAAKRDDGSAAGEQRNEHPTKGRWCLGGEAFRDRMMERIEGLLEGKDKDSIRGTDVRETGERQAEKLISKGLKILKLRNDDLENQRKGDPKKQVLAWLVRSQTTASTKWIARRLLMGDPSNVSRAVNVIQSSKNGDIRRWKKQLKR